MAERLQYVIDVSGNGDVALRKFRGELEQTERAGSRFASGIKSAALGLISFNQGLDLISKGLNFAARTFDASLGSVIKRGSELQDMSRRLGASVEMLSQFEYAAQQAGVGIGDLAGGFRGLNKALVDASKQGTDANKILQQQLGFTQQQIAAFKGDPLKAVLAIADGFNQFEDGAEKAVAAQALFGRSGQAFLQLFKDGSSEIRKNIALVKQYGANVDDNMTAAADRAGDAYDRLQLALTGVRTKLLGQPDLLNAIGSALERVADKVAEVGGAFAERFGPEIAARIESIGSAVESLMNSFDGADAIRRASEALGSAASAVSSLGSAITNLFALAQGVNNLSPLSKALVAYALFGIPGAVAYGGLSLAYGAATDAASGSAQARADVAAAEARAKAAQNPDDVRAGLFGPTGSHYYKRRYLENARAGLTPLDQNIAKPYGPEQGPGTDAGIAELMQYRGATAAGKLRTGLGGGLGGGGGGGGGKGGGSSDAEAAVKRFYDYLAQRQQDALQAGLKGEDLLIAKRDEEYLKATKLADDAKASEEQRAQAYRLIWEDYEKQIAVVRADAAEKQTKAAEEALKEQQKPFTNFIENIQRGFGDLFTSIIQDGKISGDALVGIFKQAAARLIGELVSLQLTNAFQGLLGNAAGGTSGTLTALLSAFNSGGGGSAGSGSTLGTLTSYGSSLLGGAGSLLGSGLSSVSSLLSGGSGTAALLSLGLAAAQSGGGGFKLNALSGGMLGLSAIRAVAPYLASTSYGSSLVSSLSNTTYGQGALGILGVAQPAYGVAGGAIGPPTQAAAQAGTGIAAGLSSVVSIIGSLYSLYSSVDSTIKTNKGFRQSVYGDSQASTNYAAASYAGLGAAAGTGALAGFAIGSSGGPIGMVVGALAGAAIGAAAASVVNSEVAKVVGSATHSGISKGITQGQLNRKISNGIANGIIGYLIPHMQITQNLSGGGDQALFASAFAPDIEDIFDKMGSKAVSLASGGQFAPNRRLTVYGQGTTAAQRANIAPLQDSRLRGLARLVSSISGAGRGEGNERYDRMFAILFNSLAAGGYGTEQAARRTDLAVRGLAGGSYFTATRQGSKFGAGSDSLGFVTSAQDLAFGRIFGGVDWKALRAAFESMIEAGKILRKDRKASRDAVQGALGGLLTGSTSLVEFQSSLGSALSKNLEERVNKMFLRGIGGDLLTGTFAGIRRGFRKYLKTGDAGEFSSDVAGQVAAASKAIQALNIDQLKAAFDIGLQMAVQLQIASGDIAGATATLNERLAPVVNVLKGYRQLQSDVKTRTAFALAGSGFGGQEAQLAALRSNTADAKAALLNAFPLMGFFLDNGGSIGKATPAALGTLDPERALPLLQAFSEARLSELEAELSYARQLKDTWGQVRSVSQDFLDTLTVTTKGPSARRAIYDRKLREFQIAGYTAGGDPTKQLDVLSRGSDLLSLGQSIFAPGSLEWQSLTDLLDRVAGAYNKTAVEEEAKAQERIKTAEANVTAFRDTMTPVLGYLLTLQTNAVVEAIATLTKQFTGDNGVIRILSNIATQLGVPVSGNPTARIAGASAHGNGITINIPITAGTGSADEIVAHVEKAIRQNKGKIVDEIKRVKAA